MENVTVSCSCVWAKGIVPYDMPVSQPLLSG